MKDIEIEILDLLRLKQNLEQQKEILKNDRYMRDFYKTYFSVEINAEIFEVFKQGKIGEKIKEILLETINNKIKEINKDFKDLIE